MIIKARENLEMRIREATPENAEESYNVIDRNRDYLREYLPWADGTELSGHLGTLEKWQKACEDKSEFVFGICLDGKYVGNIGLHDVKSNNKSAMIGYWLAKDYQGHGIMTDCVRALINYGFYELDLNRIWIACAFENKKSRAIPERLGFVQEAVFQDGTILHGVYHDQVIYGVVKRNWGKILGL